MVDNVCCSASNPPETTDNADHFAGEFEIGHWGLDGEGGDEEAVDFNARGSSRDNDTASYMSTTVCLEFPKFTNDLKQSDFKEFVRDWVGEDNVERLEIYRYPNIWIMDLKNQETREKLLRIWKTKIKNKTCWIIPYHDNEIRGFIHWCPHFISDDDVRTQLTQYGDVLLLENEYHHQWTRAIKSEVRYFGLRLKNGMVKNDLPHFLKIDGYRTLVVLRGRQTACFHCREFGHSKKHCKKYNEKLDDYCKNPEAKKPRTKPRGRRHRPTPKAEIDSEGSNNQDTTDWTSANIIVAQGDVENIKSSLEHENRKVNLDRNKEKLLAILQALEEWKKGTLEMVNQILANVEENLKIKLYEAQTIEAERESIEVVIKASIDEMKQVAINMIEKTLNNLKNIGTKHFGLDSVEILENIPSNFETTPEQSGQK